MIGIAEAAQAQEEARMGVAMWAIVWAAVSALGAVASALVAWRALKEQRKITKEALDHQTTVQLLERRFEHYTMVTNFLDEVVWQKQKAHHSSRIHQFARETRITPYLFGADAAAFVVEVRRTANALEEAHFAFEQTGRKSNTAEEQEFKTQSIKLARHLDDAPGVFAPYLRVPEPHAQPDLS
jgi:hypothetical protein